MTKKPSMEINTSSHLDLKLIRKVIGYEQNDKELYHYENDECVERSFRYTVPRELQMKYKEHHTAYCKDFMIYADFEAINRNLTSQAFAEVEEFNFHENKNVTVHEIVSAQYIVVINDSKLNFREDNPMFGKTFLFKQSKGSTQRLHQKPERNM